MNGLGFKVPVVAAKLQNECLTIQEFKTFGLY